MIYILEMVLMGTVATLVMDALAIVFGKAKIINQLIGPHVVGRWTLYIFRGKFFHQDINTTPALKHEKMVSLLSHYIIGIALAGVYLLLESVEPAIYYRPWVALIYGLATVVLPWFWLHPSIGLGVLASKAPRRSPYIIASLVNHTDFGLGLLIWIVFFRSFLQ